MHRKLTPSIDVVEIEGSPTPLPTIPNPIVVRHFDPRAQFDQAYIYNTKSHFNRMHVEVLLMNSSNCLREFTQHFMIISVETFRRWLIDGLGCN
jgi:hypothetical protein